METCPWTQPRFRGISHDCEDGDILEMNAFWSVQRRQGVFGHVDTIGVDNTQSSDTRWKITSRQHDL